MLYKPVWISSTRGQCLPTAQCVVRNMWDYIGDLIYTKLLQ